MLANKYINIVNIEVKWEYKNFVVEKTYVIPNKTEATVFNSCVFSLFTFIYIGLYFYSYMYSLSSEFSSFPLSNLHTHTHKNTHYPPQGSPILRKRIILPCTIDWYSTLNSWRWRFLVYVIFSLHVYPSTTSLSCDALFCSSRI